MNAAGKVAHRDWDISKAVRAYQATDAAISIGVTLFTVGVLLTPIQGSLVRGQLEAMLVDKPSPDAYQVALQAFFRRRTAQ